MKKNRTRILYPFFTLIFAGVIFAVIYFTGRQGASGGQDFYWKNSAYKVSVYKTGVNSGGSAFISLKITEKRAWGTRGSGGKALPPLDVYITGGGRLYYSSSHIAENNTVIYLFDTGITPDIIFVYPKDKYHDFSAHISFDGWTKRPVRFFVPGDGAADIHTLIKQNKVRIISVTGTSTYRTSITVENISGDLLSIKFGIGTWFKSAGNSFQNMAVFKDWAFTAKPGRIYTLHLPTVCMDKSKPFAGAVDDLVIEQFNDSELLVLALRELSALEIDLKIDIKTIQSIVWAIRSNDPAKLEAWLSFADSEIRQRLEPLIKGR